MARGITPLKVRLLFPTRSVALNLPVLTYADDRSGWLALRRGFLSLDAAAGRVAAPRPGRGKPPRLRADRRGDRRFGQERAARLPISLRAHYRAPAEDRIFGGDRTGRSLARRGCGVAGAVRTETDAQHHYEAGPAGQVSSGAETITPS